MKILIFEVDSLLFGLQTPLVREVIRAVTLSPIPHPANAAEGVLNLRGRIVPVLDMRTLLGLSTRALVYTDHLIVIDIKNRFVTLRVDRAIELADVTDENFEPVDSVVESGNLIQFEAKTPRGIVHVLNPLEFQLNGLPAIPQPMEGTVDG